MCEFNKLKVEEDFVPEGAVWTNGSSFWKEGAEGRIMFWRDEEWHNCLACTTSAGMDTLGYVKRIHKADADGWVSLPALPPRPMLCEVMRTAERNADKQCFCWFEDAFRSGASEQRWALREEMKSIESDYPVTAWRPAQAAQKAEGLKHIPASEGFARHTDPHGETWDYVRTSDDAGIDAFTAPPERERPLVAQPRISTAQRGWRWLEGWR